MAFGTDLTNRLAIRLQGMLFLISPCEVNLGFADFSVCFFFFSASINSDQFHNFYVEITQNVSWNLIIDLGLPRPVIFPSVIKLYLDIYRDILRYSTYLFIWYYLTS